MRSIGDSNSDPRMESVGIDHENKDVDCVFVLNRGITITNTASTHNARARESIGRDEENKMLHT